MRRKALPDKAFCCSCRYRQRFRYAAKSECSSANLLCAALASSCRSRGRSRGSWMLIADTTTRTSRKQPSRSASSSIRPSRGSTGSCASCFPYAVSCRRGGRLDGPQLLQQPHAVGDLPGVRRVEERKPCDVAQPDTRHLEDDRGEVGAE